VGCMVGAGLLDQGGAWRTDADRLPQWSDRGGHGAGGGTTKAHRLHLGISPARGRGSRGRVNGGDHAGGHRGGTRLGLVHRVAGEAAAEAHRTGWRYQLGLFRSLVSRDVLGRGLAGRIDRWHAVWAMTDAGNRRRILEEIAAADLGPDGRFRRITSFWLSVPPGFPTSVVPEGA